MGIIISFFKKIYAEPASLPSSPFDVVGGALKKRKNEGADGIQETERDATQDGSRTITKEIRTINAAVAIQAILVLAPDGKRLRDVAAINFLGELAIADGFDREKIEKLRREVHRILRAAEIITCGYACFVGVEQTPTDIKVIGKQHIVDGWYEGINRRCPQDLQMEILGFIARVAEEL